MAVLRDVELDLAGIIEAASLGVSMNANQPSLYAGPFPSSAPQTMIAVRFAGGDDSEDFITTGNALFSPEAQVQVRGEPGRYKATLDLVFHLPD